MDLSTMRLYGSLAIILGCFFFLYPKLMHPLVMTLFGLNTKSAETKSTGVDDLPPYLREKAKMAEAKSAGVHDDLPDHIRRMRSGPHPGMRAAAAEQSKQTRGSGKGMMGVILPMYAVGIVVYLVYTLFKVFNKKDEKRGENQRSPTGNLGKARECYEETGNYSEDEGRVSSQNKDLVTPQDLQNQLQSLVHKVQDKNLTLLAESQQSLCQGYGRDSIVRLSLRCRHCKVRAEMDVRKLQERLAETEAQMTKILAAMQAVQGKVDAAAKTSHQQDKDQTVISGPSKDSASSQDTSNNQGPDTCHQVADEEKKSQDQSTESSPGNSESYEIVNQADKETSSDVETVLPTSTQGDFDNSDAYETEEVLLEDKKPEDETVTVRQRLKKVEDRDE